MVQVAANRTVCMKLLPCSVQTPKYKQGDIHLDLRVVLHSRLHDLGGAERVPPVDEVHYAGVLCQEVCLYQNTVFDPVLQP